MAEDAGLEKFGWRMILSVVLSATVIASVITFALNFFLAEPYKASQTRKEATLERVIAPVVMNIKRTKVANDNYVAQKKYFFARIINEANSRNRELLLSNGHLLPRELIEPASCLVAHYDMWIERFDESTRDKKFAADDKIEVSYPDDKTPCSKFPTGAAQAFTEAFDRLRRDLHVDG